ncbi:hypothetical protein DCO17_03005 [Polynucleobacter tropicus]|uniref:Uncharacterized protein n=1 Tax=Polynucleobacter tropicus TaxID=1743174 RepID=A0A6M9PWN1_9BURK|nr:hypothetical protein [Polynucleobacter tropicus]QKM64292.1 hypothetical protein DCO17_03005 [Polynucleobacter tropicus]
MAIPIPSNLPINPVVDFHRNDLISPPSAPAVVESLGAIDPRVALNMPLPVVDSSAGGSLQDALQSSVGRGQPSALPTEPAVDQAVLLEISGMTADQAEAASNPSQARIDSLLSQSLSRMDNLGGAALGQLLSDILAVDVPELGQSVNAGNKNTTQSVVVNWPGADNLSSNVVANTSDPNVAMNVLYQNLQTSGIFAADQLKRLLFPASEDGDIQASGITDVPAETEKLLSQISTNAPALQDSVKLLLRGDLLWQGQLMPNVQGRLYREDAWEADPQDPSQMQKGSRITMEVTLPNLGPFKVVGTQFGNRVHVAIEAAPESQSTLANSFAQLLEQMRTQVDADAKVSLKGEAKDG